jgi:hypothetical protein
MQIIIDESVLILAFVALQGVADLLIYEIWRELKRERGASSRR